MKWFLFVGIILVLAASGCTYDFPAVNQTAPLPSPSPAVSPPPTVPVPSPSISSPPTINITPTPSPPAENVTPFTILATDFKFDPNNITVNKSDNVRIVFTFNDSEIYFAGLDIRSNYFTVEYRPSQGNKTVEFVAEQAFEFRSYWPSSGVLKAVGKVNVV